MADTISLQLPDPSMKYLLKRHKVGSNTNRSRKLQKQEFVELEAGSNRSRKLQKQEFVELEAGSNRSRKLQKQKVVELEAGSYKVQRQEVVNAGSCRTRSRK